MILSIVDGLGKSCRPGVTSGWLKLDLSEYTYGVDYHVDPLKTERNESSSSGFSFLIGRKIRSTAGPTRVCVSKA